MSSAEAALAHVHWSTEAREFHQCRRSLSLKLFGQRNGHQTATVGLQGREGSDD